MMQALNKYKLFVFDWEGTITDCVGGIFNVIQIAADNLKYGSFDKSLARQYLGLSLPLLITKLYPSLSIEKLEILLAEVGRLSNKYNLCLIDGAKELLEKLSSNGKIVGLASNCNYEVLCRRVHDFGLGEVFTAIRGAGIAPLKPSTIMLEEIMAECGMKPQDTLVIGDSVTDISMAKALDIDAIGVDFYYQNTAALLSTGAFRVFHDYASFNDFLYHDNYEDELNGF